MSYRQSIFAAMSKELGIKVEDVLDVRVAWDDGDRYDPTYPGDNEAPTFNVEMLIDSGQFTGWRSVSIETTFSALLRAVLEVGR